MFRSLAARRLVLLGIGTASVLQAGCAMLGPGATARTSRRPAPAAQSPQQVHRDEKPIIPAPHEAPLDGISEIPIELGSPVELGRIEPLETLKPSTTGPVEPIPGSTVSPIPGTAGPEMIAPGTEALTSPRPGLRLTVDVPDQVQVASHVTYRLTVVNSGNAPAEDVVVEATPDETLSLPGRDGKTVCQSLGRLTPGEQKELLLILTSSKPGRHSCQFRVLAQGQEKAWKSVAAEYVERRLDVHIVGPSRRNAGSKAEFVFKLLNLSPSPLTGVRAVVVHDAALEPQEVSAGVSRGANQLAWDLGTLPPGEGVQLQAEFACPFPSDNARLVLTVTGENVPHEQLETCLKVTPLPGILDIQVADLQDPISVGREVDYAVTVTNRGLQPLRDVRLKARLPKELQFLAAHGKVDEKDVSADYQADDGTVEFKTVSILSPDSPVVFTIRAKATVAGDLEVVAVATFAAGTEPVEVTETTTVNP